MTGPADGSTRVLVLGGTAEARELASLLAGGAGGDVAVVSSLAGRVARPRLPVGAVRVGGFGGVEGLRRWMVDHRIDAVVDATHPFAEGMSANAVAACGAEGVPLLRLERPGWSEAPGAGEWHWAEGHDAAARTAAKLGERPFLTVGRQPLDRFVPAMGELDVLVRVVDEPDVPVPDRWTVLLSRGPYDLSGESELLHRHRVDVLVTKDSGGSYTWPKIEAATRFGVPVVVVRRAASPGEAPGVTSAPAAVAWVADRLQPA